MIVNDKPAILIVDDDPSWRMIYQEIFEEQGYLVKVAASREEAEHKLGERIFDVAIIDLRLVDRDPKNQEGLEIAQRLQASPAPTRVIVKSGYLTHQVRRQLEEIGVFAALDKAGPISQLTALVASAVGPRHLQS